MHTARPPHRPAAAAAAATAATLLLLLLLPAADAHVGSDSAFPTTACSGDPESCGALRANTNKYYIVSRYSNAILIPKEGINSVAELIRRAQIAFNEPKIERLVTYTGAPLIDEAGGLAVVPRDDNVIALDAVEMWMMPANRVGEVVHVTLPDREVDVRTLSISPRVFELVDFLSDEECEHMISRLKNIRGQMYESSVGDSTATSYKSDVRTSVQSWIGPSQHNDDEVFERVRRRAVAMARQPYEVAEDTQVVHYSGEGKHYHNHHDSSFKSHTKGNPYYQGGGNRLVTFLYYLNDVADGGHTAMIYANSTLTPDSAPIGYGKVVGGFDVCDENSPGLRIQPKKGTAVMFYNLLERGTFDGEVDLKTLHAGCEPKNGSEKWLANQWIRNKRVKVGDKWHLYDDHW